METTMLKRERRYCEGLELRSMPNSELPTIIGYAAVFETLSKLLYGSFYEVIDKAYFDKVLLAPDIQIRSYRNHDKNRVCGTYCPQKDRIALTVEKDERGLKVILKPTNNTAGRDLVADIEAGNIDAMSIGHWVAREEHRGYIDGYPVRYLLECKKIDDVSFVDTPAYAETTAEFRALPGEATAEDYLKLIPPATPWLNIRKREHLLLNFD